jgi:hypothetical protein
MMHKLLYQNNFTKNVIKFDGSTGSYMNQGLYWTEINLTVFLADWHHNV